MNYASKALLLITPFLTAVWLVSTERGASTPWPEEEFVFLQASAYQPVADDNPTRQAQANRTTPDPALTVDSFAQRFTRITETPAPDNLRELFNQLRDPEDYLRRLAALTAPAVAEPIALPYYPEGTAPPSLGINTYTEKEIEPGTEQASFETLPALLTLHLEMNTDQHTQLLLVRWTDKETDIVFQMDFHESSDLAGSQILHSHPRPKREAALYQVDIFDARESLTLLASRTLGSKSGAANLHFQQATANQ